MNRQRTYAWADPLALAQLGSTMDGLEFATKLRNGDLPPPPAAVTAGITLVDVGDGWARVELEPQEWQYNPLGTVHGGILSTLADTALGIAVNTQLPRGSGFTSLDLVMKFTRSASPSDSASPLSSPSSSPPPMIASCPGTRASANARISVA